MNRLAAILTALPIVAATVFAARPAQADITCSAKNQTAFFSTFGDVTQSYDGAGSVDDPKAALYNMPAAYLNIASQWWGNGVVGTDVMMADAARPIVLQGYEKFDYEDVQSAFLRFDLYWTNYSNTEGFGIMEDETNFNGNIITFAYYDRLRSAIGRAGNIKSQWVSVRLDLRTGNAFASEIDAFGNPILDYGQFATFGDDPLDSGPLYGILKLASDGNLFPLFYDDMALSYVALYGITNGDNDCF